jgi:hypothetical protein
MGLGSGVDMSMPPHNGHRSRIADTSYNPQLLVQRLFARLGEQTLHNKEASTMLPQAKNTF